VAGTYYVSVHNTSAVPQRYDIVAYGRVPGDTNEPNDTPSTATAYQLTFDGDGPTGAIERPGDVDYFRLTCAASFAGPSEGMRLELASAFVGSLVLDADGGTYGVGVPTPPVPCGSTVVVRRAQDGSAGPAASSTYALVADAVPLYAIDAPAQSNPQTPTALGRLVLAPGETQVARLSFGSSSAGCATSRSWALRAWPPMAASCSSCVTLGHDRLQHQPAALRDRPRRALQRRGVVADVEPLVDLGAVPVPGTVRRDPVPDRDGVRPGHEHVVADEDGRPVRLRRAGDRPERTERFDERATVVSVGAAGATVTGAIERWTTSTCSDSCAPGFQFTTSS
jgi:hypothetical protein